jgi:hypothetical protein
MMREPSPRIPTRATAKSRHFQPISRPTSSAAARHGAEFIVADLAFFFLGAWLDRPEEEAAARLREALSDMVFVGGAPCARSALQSPAGVRKPRLAQPPSSAATGGCNRLKGSTWMRAAPSLFA